MIATSTNARLGLGLLACSFLAAAPLAARAADELPPPPTHPDTLPTLFRTWSLPAALTGYVRNVHAPRFALDEPYLYVFDHHGRRLAATDVRSGKVLWHAPVPARSDRAFAFTPFVHAGNVIVAADGLVYAFDARSGRRRWRLAIKGVAVNGMAHSKHRVFVPWLTLKGRHGQPGVNIWGIDSRDGRVEWSKRFVGGSGYVKGNADGAYLVNDGGAVFALTPDRGELKWQLRVPGRVVAPPLLEGGNLFITTLRKKTGWSGTGVYCVDVRNGKLRWKARLSTKRISAFTYRNQLAVIDSSGWLTVYDNADGKPSTRIQLPFGEAPTTIAAAASGTRAYVFTSDADKHGLVWLVDLDKKRMLAAANALDMRVRYMATASKTVILDGEDGAIHAFRLDRSQRPRRGSVPPAEFAEELVAEARKGRGTARSLAVKLAGLGAKAIAPIESALGEQRPEIVTGAARALGMLKSRRSVRALLDALRRWTAEPPRSGADPALAIVGALARIRDSKAIKPLAAIMKGADQGQFRRRAAYVALGAIGSPPALAPIWAFRATKQITAQSWDPQSFTPSLEYRVERDFPADEWPDAVRQRTARTVQTKSGQIYTAALSPYLGGYNDVWVGRSDLAGRMQDPYFTGLTKAEIWPNRRIRIKQFEVDEQGKATLRIELPRGKGYIAARPVELSLPKLAEDTDGDRLPDVVEQRMRLCTTHGDCDGDGVSDLEDLNPLASSKQKLTRDQQLFREAFFSVYAFLDRRGIVVVDPGKGPSFELYGRRDPILSLRRSTIERLRKEIGLHGADFVSFGGPYPEGSGSGDALPEVVIDAKGTSAKLGIDIVRAGNNAVAYNVSLRRFGKNWVVTKLTRVWSAQ